MPRCPYHCWRAMAPPGPMTLERLDTNKRRWHLDLQGPFAPSPCRWSKRFLWSRIGLCRCSREFTQVVSLINSKRNVLGRRAEPVTPQNPRPISTATAKPATAADEYPPLSPYCALLRPDSKGPGAAHVLDDLAGSQFARLLQFRFRELDHRLAVVVSHPQVARGVE